MAIFYTPHVCSTNTAKPETINPLYIFRMTEDSDLTPRMARLMSAIWNDVGLQHCASRNKDYQLFDSAIFFLNSLERIAAPNYIPTFDDMLRSRIKTTGIIEMQFNFKVYLAQ